MDYVKVYDEQGRQLAPTSPDDPMFSVLYCQEYITDCDRVITVQFNENVYTGRQVTPLTIRIDAAYNTIDSIHKVLKEHFINTQDDNSPYKEYPALEDLDYYYTKKDHPTIKLNYYEWLDNCPYNNILVKKTMSRLKILV